MAIVYEDGHGGYVTDEDEPVFYDTNTDRFYYEDGTVVIENQTIAAEDAEFSENGWESELEEEPEFEEEADYDKWKILKWGIFIIFFPIAVPIYLWIRSGYWEGKLKIGVRVAIVCLCLICCIGVILKKGIGRVWDAEDTEQSELVQVEDEESDFVTEGVEDNDTIEDEVTVDEGSEAQTVEPEGIRLLNEEAKASVYEVDRENWVKIREAARALETLGTVIKQEQRHELTDEQVMKLAQNLSETTAGIPEIIINYDNREGTVQYVEECNLYIITAALAANTYYQIHSSPAMDALEYQERQQLLVSLVQSCAEILPAVTNMRVEYLLSNGFEAEELQSLIEAEGM